MDTRIFLTGVSCIGKTAVGEALAALLRVDFFDLDGEVEKYFGTSIERLQSIVAEFGKSKALDGLKQATNDIVEELGNRPPEFLAQLDATLRDRGIITFSEVRRRYAAAYRRILKRGKILSETEYYLIRGIVSDFPGQASVAERVALEAMLAEYERHA